MIMPSPPEWATEQQKKQAECPHKHTEVALIVSMCKDCGITFNHAIKDLMADLTTLIHQGLVPLETAIEANPSLTDEEVSTLRAVTPCQHIVEDRETYTCKCSGGERERCRSCGRVFASPSQWILIHEKPSEEDYDNE